MARRRESPADVLKVAIICVTLAFAFRTFAFEPAMVPTGSEEPNIYRGDFIVVAKWAYGYSRYTIMGSPPLFRGRLLFTPPKRGDIVVFKLPRDGRTNFVKRLVGLPGDRVQMRQGELFVNGQRLARESDGLTDAVESSGADAPPRTIRAIIVKETNLDGRQYRTQLLEGGGPGENTSEYVVPPHCYFMMGDNRDNSADSRFDPGVPPGDPRLKGCNWDPTWNTYANDGLAPGDLGAGLVPEENLMGRAVMVLVSWDMGVDEWHNPGASLMAPNTWLRYLRPERSLQVLN